MTITLFIIPLLSALVGWLIHFGLAHYLLTTYLPAQQPKIAGSLSKKAQSYADTHIDIDQKLGNPALMDKVMPMIEGHIDEFLNVKLVQEIPMLSMFIGNKTTDKIKEVFVNQLKQLFPKVMQGIVGPLKKELNIEAIVYKEIMAANLTQVLKTQRISGKIQLTGLVTGFVIGIINALFFYLLA